MKAIRYLAACLLLIDGILHLYFAAKGPSDPDFAIGLVGGIGYCVIGVLFIMNKKFAFWFGLIGPIIALAVTPFMVDLKTLGAIDTTILVCDLLLVIFCLILLLNKNKS
jgi:uncharacterized membrane protein HdeD (DUF308 family)